MPIQQKTLEKAINEAKEKLQGLLTALSTFKFPDPSSTKFYANNIVVDEIVKDLPTGSDSDDFIYFFKVVGQNKTNNEFFEQLSTAKKKQGTDEDKKDLPKLNKEHIDTQYLYVGRSQKLRSRIRQHLGEGYCGTYAMHMDRWSKNISEQVEIQYFKLENKDNLLVQSVEDSLWDQLKPCFGRKGDK